MGFRAEGSMAERTPREPRDEDARDHEADRREGIFEMSLRPHTRPNERDEPIAARRRRPHTFADDERIAAQDDRDVVIPAWKGAPFVGVEPELAFELLVGAFGTPSLLDRTSDVLLAHPSRERRERELRRTTPSFGPLDDEPHGLPILGGRAVIVSHDAPAEAELREPRTKCAVAPGQMPEAFSSDLKSELPDGDRLPAAPATSVDTPSSSR